MTELDLIRGFGVLVIYNITTLIFIILGVKVARNISYKVSDKIFLAGTFFLYALGAMINISYFIGANILAILPEPVLIFLYSFGISIFLIINLFYYIFQYSKRNVYFKPKTQYITAIIFILIVIPLTLLLGFNFVEFNVVTGWVPVHRFQFALYFIAALSTFILLEIREAYKIHRTLIDCQRKDSAIQWKQINLGILGIPVFMLIPAFSNMTSDPFIRGVATICFLFVVVFTIILYSGLTSRKLNIKSLFSKKKGEKQ